MDGNEAAAFVAHKTNEVVAIYPITPASPMGELADLWTAGGRTNLWGTVPEIIEMQSEGGAAGAVHGALQTGSLTTTFTASQGLLLMVPNMFKIAGELTPTVFHIAARSVAAQALSIFGDHSDVMAARTTGWAMLFAANVQEVMDMALLAQAATLRSRVPFLHVFDGFRTSHELQRVEILDDDTMRALLPATLVREHRARALTPDRPVIRGTAQNPDVFFQARETVNPFYARIPDIVEEVMRDLAQTTGRHYNAFDYVGHPSAERILVLMGSGCETATETIEHLVTAGERVGLVKVRLYRPFDAERFVASLPTSTTGIAVLDRTKEPGAAGEPLYVDVQTALAEVGDVRFPAGRPRVIGGRYGLSSKEFTPAMAKAALDELNSSSPVNHFTLGINDDVSHSSLSVDETFDTEPEGVQRAVFWGLGSDGTVGANKNSIKIIGEQEGMHVQGYFVYDSRKAGARTISHLRFGPTPIRSTYLIRQAQFVGVHQFGFFERYDTLAVAAPGATVLINAPHPPDEVWAMLPRGVQQQVLERDLKLFAIDAMRIAADLGLGGRINTVMQACFFALSKVIPVEQALDAIKRSIRETYEKRGEAVVRLNFAAVDAALSGLSPVPIGNVESHTHVMSNVPPDAPEFVRDVTGVIIAGRGDDLPVSALPVDGTFPTGTSRYEKRNLALEVPVWDPEICIQCGKCVAVCPHAVIRAKVADADALADAPESFLSAAARWRELPDLQYTLQVAVEDCTGCRLCFEICPVKDKAQPRRRAVNMEPLALRREQGIRNWEYFLNLPEVVRANGQAEEHDFLPLPVLHFTKTKDVQLLDPLFEFSGACAGCGETPYLSLLTRLFGDRALVANATGCSSIYGGNLPTTPWTTNREGRGPAWSNSLFEDNAEFGLGMRLALDKQAEQAAELIGQFLDVIGNDLSARLTAPCRSGPEAVAARRADVELLKQMLSGHDQPEALDLLALADALVPKSVWIVGGDGWAYDIGYGGLDHVLATGRNVNLLVLDTELYSNTGGQASKATGLGAVAKFAAAGKSTPKKDLGMLATSYGYVYVANVALGADDNQVTRAFLEAEAYDGPSLIIAYSPCIAHGIDMARSVDQSELAVRSGYWPLYRFDPTRTEPGQNPFQLDSKPPSISFRDYAYRENRYRVLQQVNPEGAANFLRAAQDGVNKRWQDLKRKARIEDAPEQKPPPGSRPKPTISPRAVPTQRPNTKG